MANQTKLIFSFGRLAVIPVNNITDAGGRKEDKTTVDLLMAMLNNIVNNHIGCKLNSDQNAFRYVINSSVFIAFFLFN